MKNKCIRFLFLLPFFAFAQPGTLLYNQLIAEYELDEIPELLTEIGIPSFLVNQNFGIELYKIGYETSSPLGDSIIPASGLIVVPKSTNYEFPIFHYNAGTHPYGENLSDLDNEALALAMIAIEGNISIVPDYIGYGDSPIDIPHPYLHEETQANASIDLLKASQIFLNDINVNFNNDLILGGYSQGAHAALSTLKYLEEDNTENYNIVGTFTGAGPYYLSGPVIDSILSGNQIEGYFLPFLIEGYQYMYGDLYEEHEDAYNSPWDTIVPKVFDKEDPLSIEDVIFPESPIDVLNPGYLYALQNDTNHIVRQHLKTNDLHTGWYPYSPTSLYHCSSDNYVPITSSQNTFQAFQEAGAPAVNLIENETPNLSHVDCFTPYLLLLKIFIANNNAHGPLYLTELDPTSSLEWYSDKEYIYINSKNETEQIVTISTIQGKRIYSEIMKYSVQIPVQNIASGYYLIRVGTSTFKFVR